MRVGSNVPPPAVRLRRRGVESRSGTRPAQHGPRRRARSARRSTTVDGVPGQLAAVEHEVGAARGSPPGRRRAAARRARRRALARALQHRASARAGRAPASVGHAQAERARVRPAGQREARRGFGSSSVTPPGSSRSSSARVRGPSSGSAASASSRSKNITAAGLSGAAALERVQRARRPRAVVRVARQPVDRVGREHGDAAARDAARRTSRRRRAAHRRPTTTRSMPGQVGARPRSRRSRPRAASSATASAWPAPTSSATQRGAARRRRARGGGSTSSPSAPAYSATRRLVARDLGRERPRRRRRRTAGWRRTASSGPVDRLEQVALEQLDVEPEPRARWRARRPARPALASVPTTLEVGPLVP